MPHAKGAKTAKVTMGPTLPSEVPVRVIPFFGGVQVKAGEAPVLDSQCADWLPETFQQWSRKAYTSVGKQARQGKAHAAVGAFKIWQCVTEMPGRDLEEDYPRRLILCQDAITHDIGT